jgi:tetratricopeptide (TPR) repeat protein
MSAAPFRTLTFLGVVFALLLALGPVPSPAADTNSTAVAAPVPKSEDTNASLDTLRAYLELQGRLREAEAAIERNRQEAEAAATRNAEAVTNWLQQAEQTLAAQRAREWDAMQKTNWLVLIVAGAFAVVGVLAMLLNAFLQWRAMNRAAEFYAMPGSALALGARRALAAFGPGDAAVVSSGAAEQSNARLLGIVERLERRILELEQIAHVPPNEHATIAAAPVQTAAAIVSSNPGTASRATVLLAKGQSLLDLDQPEKAVACFDEALALEPNHAEALIKKGVALERLRKTDEAIQCYDGAIAADGSMTLAYLYKGGLYNRLERYNEALECYEQALRTQEHRPG